MEVLVGDSKFLDGEGTGESVERKHWDRFEDHGG
jgi:hypothetical protein